MFSRQRSLSLIFLILFLVHLGQAQARFLFAPPPGFSLTGKNDWGSMCNGGRNPYPNFEPDLATTSYFKEALIALGVVSGSFIAAGAVEYIGALLIRWGLGALLTFWGIDKILDYLPLDIEVYVYLGFLSHGAGDECSFTMSGISSYLRTPHVYFDPATAAGVKTTYIEGEFYLNYQGATNGQSIGKYQVCWLDGNNGSGCGTVRQFPTYNTLGSWVRLDYVEQTNEPQYYKEVWLVIEAMGGPYLIDDIGLRGYGKEKSTPTPTSTATITPLPTNTPCAPTPVAMATTCANQNVIKQLWSGSSKVQGGLKTLIIPTNFVWKGSWPSPSTSYFTVANTNNLSGCNPFAQPSTSTGGSLLVKVGDTVSYIVVKCSNDNSARSAIITNVSYSYLDKVCTSPPPTVAACGPTATNTRVVQATNTVTVTPSPTGTRTPTSVSVTVPPREQPTVDLTKVPATPTNTVTRTPSPTVTPSPTRTSTATTIPTRGPTPDYPDAPKKCINYSWGCYQGVCQYSRKLDHVDDNCNLPSGFSNAKCPVGYVPSDAMCIPPAQAPKPCDFDRYQWLNDPYLVDKPRYVVRPGWSDPSCTDPGPGGLMHCPIGYVPSDAMCSQKTVTPSPTPTLTPTPTQTPGGTIYDGMCECSQSDVNHPLYPVLCRQEILLCLIRDYNATIAAKEWAVNVTVPPFPTAFIQIIITPGEYPTVIVPVTVPPQPTHTATPCLSCKILEGFATEVAGQTKLQQTMVALLAKPTSTSTPTPTGSPTLQVSLPPLLADGCYSPQSSNIKAIDDDLMTKTDGTVTLNFTPPPGQELVGIQAWGHGAMQEITVEDETIPGRPLNGQEDIFFTKPHPVNTIKIPATGLAEVAVCFEKPLEEPNASLDLPEGCYSPLGATGGTNPDRTIDDRLDTWGTGEITYEIQQFFPDRVLVGLVAWGKPGATIADFNIAYNNYPDESISLPIMFNGGAQLAHVREDVTFPSTLLGTFLTGERTGVDQVTFTTEGDLVEVAFCFADPRPTPTPVIQVYDREPNCFTPKSAEAFGLNFVNGPSAIDENLGTFSVGDLKVSFDIPLNKRIATLSVWGTPLGGGLVNAISELEIVGPRGSQTLVRNHAFNASIHNLQPYVKEDLVINDIFTDSTDITIKVSGTNQINEVNICYEDIDAPIVTPMPITATTTTILTPTLYITPVLRINEIDNCVAPMSHAADQWPLFDGDLNTELQQDITLTDNGDYAMTGLMLWSTGNSQVQLTFATGVVTSFNIVSPAIMTPTLKRLTIPSQRVTSMTVLNNGDVQEFRICYDFMAASLANAGLSGSGGSSLRCDPRCSSPERVWSSTGQDYNMLIDDDPNTCWVGGQNQKATVVNGVLQYFGVGGNLANWVVSGVAPEQFIIQAPRGINYQASSLQFISVGDNNNRVTEISYAAPYINVPPELIPLWTNLDGNNILAGIFGGNWFTSQNMNAALPGQLVKDEASFASVFQAEYFKIKMARDGQPPVMCEVCVCGNDTAAPTPVPPGPGTDWLRYVELMCMLQVLICDVGPGGVFTPTHVMTQTIVISGSPQSEMVNTQMLSTMMEIRDFLSNTGQITPSQMISINLTPIITIAWPTATPTITPTVTPTATLTATPTPTLTPTPLTPIVPFTPTLLVNTALVCGEMILVCPSNITDTLAAGYPFCLGMTAWQFNVDIPAPVLADPRIYGQINYCYINSVNALGVDLTTYLAAMSMFFAFGSVIFLAKRRHNS